MKTNQELVNELKYILQRLDREQVEYQSNAEDVTLLAVKEFYRGKISEIKSTKRLVREIINMVPMEA